MHPRQEEMSPVTEMDLQNNWSETYTTHLRTLLQDETIVIDNKADLPAVVLLGALGPENTSRCYMAHATMKSLNDSADQIKQDNDQSYYIEFHHKSDVIKRIQMLYLQQAIIQFRGPGVLALRPMHHVYEKFDNLLKMLSEAEWSDDKLFQYICLTDHFANLALKLHVNQALTIDEINQSAEALANKLPKQQPVNRSIKIAVYAVLGALAGFILGLAFGSVLTGGVGGLPAAFAAAFKGSALAVSIAEIGFGAFLGSSFGFFAARKDERLAHAQHQEKLRHFIPKEADEVFESLKPPIVAPQRAPRGRGN
jgi:hypothetical protein